MKKLSKAKDIWPACEVQESDIQEAIDYATISLPWTFDRLRYGPRSQKAVNSRLLHILMGVLNQTILERVLTSRGFECSKDWKKYRESDVFDFMINRRKYDVKTVHIYSKYNSDWDRKEFSIKLLMANKDYDGPEWRRFFPMMVTISQLTIDKMKDSYIFGIAETYEDLRLREPILSDAGFWCAAPYARAHNFLHSTRVINQREEEDKGFKLKVSWRRTQRSLIEGEKKRASITLFGEWTGDRRSEVLELTEGKTVLSDKEFSSLSCVRFDHPAILDSYDTIVVTAENFFDQFISKPTKPSINLNNPDFEWKLKKDSFVNLQVPEDYKVYWIGHIPFKEFASKFPSHKSYFIPHPKNMNRNQPGVVNARSRKKLESLDRKREKAIAKGIKIPWPEFLSLVDDKNHIKAGLLLSAMRGRRPIGAACYVYPPYALWETALYVLPGDLYAMDYLPKA